VPVRRRRGESVRSHGEAGVRVDVELCRLWQAQRTHQSRCKHVASISLLLTTKQPHWACPQRDKSLAAEQRFLADRRRGAGA
jgi:hypothetical protein